jgi:hypothetical protein
LKPRRGYWSKGARLLALIPVWLLAVPVVRVLELFGRWPLIMARGMARTMAEAPHYEPTAHDIMICSFFKSGTNWTMQLVTQIACQGRGEYDHIHDIVPWLELPERFGYAVSIDDESTWTESPTGLRAIKTHLPMSKLHYSRSSKYLWIVRDPKDVFVSGYRFVASTMLGPLTPSVKNWLELFFTDTPFNGSWAEHLAGGWKMRHEPNLLFMTFEEMKRDLPGTVRRVADFMQVDLTAEELENATERSSYAWMKQHSSQFDTRGLSPPWATPRGAMVRRGESGSADELLSIEDQLRIDDFCRSELARLGSDFPYDDYYS